MSEAENTCTRCGVKWKDITAPCPKSLTGSGVHTFYGDFRGFSSVAGSTGTEVKTGLTHEEAAHAALASSEGSKQGEDE